MPTSEFSNTARADIASSMPEKEYRFVSNVNVAISAGDLNIRKGAPSSSSPIVREATPGTPLRFIGFVLDGEAIAGIAKWFLTPDGDFFWSGNVRTDSVDPAILVSKRILHKPLETMVCTQRFGERAAFYEPLGLSGGHNGMDFRTRQDGGSFTVPVYAVMKGIVSEVNENSWSGKYVRIDHPNGFQSQYNHLSDTNLEAGQEVTGGMKIGVAGNTGAASESPHLHFGYRPIKFDNENGFAGYIDPAPYFVDEIKYLT